MDLPKRKRNRLQGYDYAQSGIYFITFCIQDKACVLWDRRGAQCAPEDAFRLSPYGIVVDKAIKDIPKKYPMISLEHYAVMPNHIHLLLLIDNFESAGGSAMRSPTVSTVINQFKGYVSKKIGKQIWQRSFHDHIVRDEHDFAAIWQYIDENPLKWNEDFYYI